MIGLDHGGSHWGFGLEAMQTLPNILAGCKVFPCVPNGKEPATRDGWKIASDDPAQIAEWSRINPNFNWAVATGLSGLFVIDVDPNGLDWWAKLLERDADIRAAVDRAYQVRTPRGGLHVYFKGEGPSTASRIAEGIDTRGGINRNGTIVSGGYVLLPGSKTPNGSYSELPGGVIADLPPSIVGIVPDRKKTDTLGLAKNPDKDLPRNVQTAMDLIGKYVRDGRVSVQGKGGDNTAFAVAASILDKGISPGLAFDMLAEHWNPACQPPWDEWELETKIRNAANHGEDTSSGSKGFQANSDAFAHFAGQEFETAPKPRERDKLKWLHDYADGVQDPAWLIPGVLPASGVGMLYGQSGSYKSFLALDMALCLAFGIPGQWGAPPVKNDVLFLAGEGSIATAKKRWPAWMQWQDVQFRNDHRMIVKDRVPFFTDTDGWDNIKIDLAELGAKPALIVIDTLARLTTGMDENTAKDATLITTFMESLARHYECFVLAVHHEGKDAKRGARGSSAFYANMDVVLSTRKCQGGTELRSLKQKDADAGEEVHYFEMKEMATSIVLARAKSGAAPIEQKPGKSRYDWATLPEVVRALTVLGGKASFSILAQDISSRHDVDTDLVRKQLLKSEELKWLRDGNNWVIPAEDAMW